MSIKKDDKRNTWYCYGYYKDLQGKSHQYKKRGFKTKSDAKNYEHDLLIKLKSSIPSITLDELVIKYHTDYVVYGVKQATLISCESYYRSHIKDDLGNIKVCDINRILITQWVTKKASLIKKNGKPYATATIQKMQEILSKYLTYAVRQGYIEYNPCHSVPRFKRPDEIKEKDINFWEVDTFKKFMSEVNESKWQDVFTFMFYTGVREGELFALQWKDIDFNKSTCSITKTATNKNLEGHVTLTAPKTKNSIRTIDLPKSLLDRLALRMEHEKKKDGYTLDYFVFGDIKPLSRQKLAKQLDYYISKSNVPRITPHGFRHSHASYLIKTGKIDDQLIADRLGHTVEELRKTYAHIYAESRCDLKNVLEDIF